MPNTEHASVRLAMYMARSMLLLYFTLLQFYFQIRRFTLRRRCSSFAFLPILRIVFSQICSQCTSHLNVLDCSHTDRNRIYAYAPQSHGLWAYQLMHIQNWILLYFTANDVARICTRNDTNGNDFRSFLSSLVLDAVRLQWESVSVFVDLCVFRVTSTTRK